MDNFLKKFNSDYLRYVVNGIFLESPNYYKRYKSRYYSIMKAIVSFRLSKNSKILEIGGGQIALLAGKMLGVYATVCDVSDINRSYVEKLGFSFMKLDLVKDEPFCSDNYDVVILSEVIEHIPIPPYLVFDKVRKMLCDDGTLILTTPNLYSIRNLVHLFMGKKLFGSFFYPSPGEYCREHVLEYSLDHLEWQLARAGFTNIKINYCQFHHNPNKLFFKILYWIGIPIFLIPRFRQNLMCIAKKRTLLKCKKKKNG